MGEGGREVGKTEEWREVGEGGRWDREEGRESRYGVEGRR